MKKITDTESLLRVYEKPDGESLLIPRPASFNELGVFSQPHFENHSSMFVDKEPKNFIF